MTKPLTARELDIARLYLQGKTPREIADKLYLSIKTVGVHWHHIKLKSGSRTAIQFAFSPMGKALLEDQPQTTATP